MDTRVTPISPTFTDARAADLMDRIALAEQQVATLEGEQQRMARHELALLETELVRLTSSMTAV
jgi:hypothetical protein